MNAMTKRPLRRRNVNPKRGELKTISLEASTHPLSTGPFKGQQVGALTTEVLEGQKWALTEKYAAGAGNTGAAQLTADLKAIEDERQRRWLAFVA